MALGPMVAAAIGPSLACVLPYAQLRRAKDQALLRPSGRLRPGPGEAAPAPMRDCQVPRLAPALGAAEITTRGRRERSVMGRRERSEAGI